MPEYLLCRQQFKQMPFLLISLLKLPIDNNLPFVPGLNSIPGEWFLPILRITLLNLLRFEDELYIM
jgi:hypothetical protein